MLCSSDAVMYCVTYMLLWSISFGSPAEVLSAELLHWNDVIPLASTGLYFLMLIYKTRAFISTYISSLRFAFCRQIRKHHVQDLEHNDFLNIWMFYKDQYVWSVYSLTMCSMYLIMNNHFNSRWAAVGLQSADEAAETTVLHMSCCLFLEAPVNISFAHCRPL